MSGEAPFKLCVIELARESEPVKAQVWSLVVELSELQDADSFTVDATTAKRPTTEMRRRIGLLTVPVQDEFGRRPLRGHEALVKEVGMFVTAIDLYSGIYWITGAYDWGDGVVTLLESKTWETLRRLLEEHELTYEAIAEYTRPTIASKR